MILPPILEAAIELQAALEELHFPFCFIGGLSVQRWGEPRFTQDADATVLTRFVGDERLVSELRPLADLKGDPSIVGRLEALMERRGVVDRVNKPPERL